MVKICIRVLVIVASILDLTVKVRSLFSTGWCVYCLLKVQQVTSAGFSGGLTENDGPHLQGIKLQNLKFAGHEITGQKYSANRDEVCSFFLLFS